MIPKWYMNLYLVEKPLLCLACYSIVKHPCPSSYSSHCFSLSLFHFPFFSSTSLFPFKPYGCIFQVKEQNKYKVLHHIKLHFPKWGNTTRTHEIQFVTYENNKITPSSSSAWNIMMFKWFYTVHEIIFIFYMSDSIQPFNLEN